MKEGWEYKKIKDVADVIGGSTPKTNVEEYWGGDNYWVTPAELDGSKYIDKTVRCITSKAVDKTNLTLMPSGTVLLSSRAPIGKVCITKAPMYCNQGFKNLVCKELLYNEFAYYFLKHNVAYLQSLGTGATFKEISKKVVENVAIPIPPLSEQQHIVEELDLLSSIIEKKKAQLNELDNLAQSLFYEMFGDPITNEKGWEIGEIGNFINVRGGFAFKSQRYTNNGIRLVQIANVWKDSLSWDNITYVSEEDAKTNSSFLLKQGDIVMAMTRPIIQSLEAVKVAVVNEHDIPCILNQRVCKFEIRNSIDNIWLYQFLRLPYFKYKIKEFSSKGMQPNVSSREIESVQFFVPPLNLQQQFASKIEAIECQKELIKQSIKEVETLFNSRMDYYFN